MKTQQIKERMNTFNGAYVAGDSMQKLVNIPAREQG